MVPLQVTAKLRGGVVLPNGPLMLDALLGAAICIRDGIQPAHNPEDLVPLYIPIARAEHDPRIYLCSGSEGEVEVFDGRFVNRRFPLTEAQGLAEPGLKRILITGGPCKSYRLPLVVQHMRDDKLVWWAIGDAGAVRDLLGLISYLGKRRGVGYGEVAAWEVAQVVPWGDGFPVVREGQPTRPLPPSWPGLSPDVEQAFRVLSPPYWRQHAEELCAIPRWQL